MKRFVLRALLVLVSLGLAAAGAEMAVRALDPFGISYYRDNHRYFQEAVEDVIGEPGGRGVDGRLFEQKPGVDMELVTFTFRTDAFGLRSAVAGAPLSPPEPEERLRVLLLGDSVTLAWGVGDAVSWARVLEREGRAADGRPLEVLNAGHLMYETVQQADLLRAWGPELRPEVVLLMYIANDLVSSYGAIQSSFAEQQAAKGLPAPLEALVSGVRSAFPGLRGLWRYHAEAERLAGIPDRAFGTIEDVPGYPDGWPRSAAALEEIRARCAELGARFVVLDHTIPTLPELEAWCRDAGVERVRTAFTDEEWRGDIRNSAADAHFNARGNHYIAEKVLRGLRELGVLGPEPAAGAPQ